LSVRANRTCDFTVLVVGTENDVFQKTHDIVIGLIFMTGTVVKIGQRLAASFVGVERRSWTPISFFGLT
jgi:uncharacterized membrane protein YoaK (UPF0700 family)